jgi:flagellar capping protein FliD
VVSQAVSAISQSLSVAHAAVSNLTSADVVLSNAISATNATVSNLTSAHNALSNVVSVFGGSSGDTYVAKTLTETVSTATIQSDDSLFFSVATSANYQFDLVLYMTANSTTTDHKLAWTVPAGTTMLWGLMGDGALTWNGGAASPASFETEATTALAQSGSNITYGHLCKGQIVTAGTGGAVQLQWANNVSAANMHGTVLPGSHIKYKRLY